jgi:hypothetical protein
MAFLLRSALALTLAACAAETPTTAAVATTATATAPAMVPATVPAPATVTAPDPDPAPDLTTAPPPAATSQSVRIAWSPRLLARLTREANAKPAGAVVLQPPADAERDEAIHRMFGTRCHLERTCGPLWGVDCGAAADGPYFYARPYTDRMERITVCGGACMGGHCTNCPPRDAGWTCPTY